VSLDNTTRLFERTYRVSAAAELCIVDASHLRAPDPSNFNTLSKGGSRRSLRVSDAWKYGMPNRVLPR